MSTLWVDRDFQGLSKTSDSGGYRYYWNRWGATNDVFSSMRAWGQGDRGHAFAFEHIDFNGRFAALNVESGASSWWSYFGSSFNDVVSSSLLVVRAPSDILVPLRQQVAPTFASMFDAQTAGTQLSREGDPRVYGTFFPGHDADRVFMTIDQDLNVAIDTWPDYSANVKYDVEFYLSGGKLHGYARWSHVWVESGIFSGDVHDAIAPRLHAAKGDITSAIEAQLAVFADMNFSDTYLLPGPQPDMARFGYFAAHDDDICLAVVPA
ncbi:hypothetical protein [Actinocorallia herbida]|uniref:hypothetical protein n=1 Tax=Actinocorallia herbida TaxID=58109 RepID=UPI0011CE7A51|nr:hypothetical protein [Actinocorallia herbida]